MIQSGENWGISDQNTRIAEGGDLTQRIRTSNRTNNYCNEELTIKLNQRLPEELLEAVEASPPYTSVRGLHPNWRVGRYQPGQTFPAHQDQADFVTVRQEERGRQRFTSSHTLLVNLRQPGQDFQGGATRFFMEGELDPGYYQVHINLTLPQEPTEGELWTSCCPGAGLWSSSRRASSTPGCQWRLGRAPNTSPRPASFGQSRSPGSSRGQPRCSSTARAFRNISNYTSYSIF